MPKRIPPPNDVKPAAPRGSALDGWLRKIGADKVNETKMKIGFDPQASNSTIEFWRYGAKLFIVQRFTQGATITGWEIYIPASESNISYATFQAVEKYLGIEKDAES